MKRSLWWKEKLFLKDKSFWSLLCFKDKESDENVLVFCKSKASNESTSLYLKVIRYLFLWNIKSYDNESYNILREEVYEEKFCYSIRFF